MRCRNHGAALVDPALAIARCAPAIRPRLVADARGASRRSRSASPPATGSKGRMQAKEALRAQYDERERARAGRAREPAGRRRLGVAQVSRRSPRPANTSPQRQILIDNKVAAGRAGFHVVTPLALRDGRVVLVNRGWIAQQASRSVLPEAPPPAGEVTVRGRIAIPRDGLPRAQARLDQRSGSAEPRSRARFAAATGLAVLPVVVEATERAGSRRRARPRVAGARLRRRHAPDLHGAVVRVRAPRRARCGSGSIARAAKRRGRWLTARRQPADARRRGAPRRGGASARSGSPRSTLAPIVASYAVYYFFPASAAGQLRNAAADGADPGIEGTRPDGSPFRLDELRGRWVLVALGGGDCDAGCERRLLRHAAGANDAGQGAGARRAGLSAYGRRRAFRQRCSRSTPGSSSRASRMPSRAKFPAARGRSTSSIRWATSCLRYPDDPDIKGIARDLTRLLKASRIG